MMLLLLHDRPSDRRPLFGPLRMYPAAEDNYGTDACSILCLETRPPVLVIATCEGKLHHCLLLNQPVDDGEDNDSISLVCKIHLLAQCVVSVIMLYFVVLLAVKPYCFYSTLTFAPCK